MYIISEFIKLIFDYAPQTYKKISYKPIRIQKFMKYLVHLHPKCIKIAYDKKIKNNVLTSTK